MALSHTQLEELSLLQDKYINKEITKAQYDSLKAEIVAESKKATPSHKKGYDKSEEKNIFEYAIDIIVWVYRTFLKIMKFTIRGLHTLHTKLVYIAHTRKVGLGKVYLSLFACIVVPIAIFMGISAYASYSKEVQEKTTKEQMVLEEQMKQAEEKVKQQAIEGEKAKTPHPSIALLSNTGSQGKKMEYVLRFSSTGADTVTVNSETMSMNGSGTYEKSIVLPLGETSITILAKNKYFSDTLGFMVSREKTDAEIKTEEQEKTRIDEEVRKEAEQEILAEKQKEAEKKQQLDDEKKTYTSISYAKLKKSTDSYTGKRIKFNGKIFTATESNGTTAFQINTDGDGYSDQIVVVANWQNDYVEGNWVTIWGEVVDEFCYTSQAGWNICVPRVKANIIE